MGVGPRIKNTAVFFNTSIFLNTTPPAFEPKTFQLPTKTQNKNENQKLNNKIIFIKL